MPYDPLHHPVWGKTLCSDPFERPRAPDKTGTFAIMSRFSNLLLSINRCRLFCNAHIRCGVPVLFPPHQVQPLQKFCWSKARLSAKLPIAKYPFRIPVKMRIVFFSHSSSSLVFALFTAGYISFEIRQWGKLNHVVFIEFHFAFYNFELNLLLKFL